MSTLRPNLFDTDFEQLVSLGRALLPKHAPEWTDHNLHDPGIMLIELLAWTAEAQMYSLARLRTDERWAYGALLGLVPRGPIPARGLVWPTSEIPGRGTVLPLDAEVAADHPQAPRFCPERPINLMPARLVNVETRLSNGRILNRKESNDRPGAGYYPFGEEADAGDRFMLTFEGSLLAPENLDSRTALLSLGVRVSPENPAAPATSDPDDFPVRTRSPLSRQLVATLLDGQFRYALPVKKDGSNGFLRTGAILLDLSKVPEKVGPRFTIEIESRGSGLVGPPRIFCIKPNVLPVVQQVTRPLTVSAWGRDGIPDQLLELEENGILYPQPAVVDHPHDGLNAEQGEGNPTVPGLRVRLGRDEWKYTDALSECGPEDQVFSFDPSTRQLRFGNGINGKTPPKDADLQVEYATTDGLAGNLPAGFGWTVSGIGGIFGINEDPTTGGAAALDLQQLRQLARQKAWRTDAIVTSPDLENAALALADLRVARAEALPMPDMEAHCAALFGTRTLVVLKARPAGSEIVENSRWLAEVHRELAPRLPLGERLRVVEPDYAPLRIKATLLARSGYDPNTIEADALRMLEMLFTLIPAVPGGEVWPLGRPVELLDIKARLRNIDGVAGVKDCELDWGDSSSPAGQPKGSKRFLPLWQGGQSRITVERISVGRAL